MAQSARSIPANYPQPLGMQLLRADAQRQDSIARQEIVTDLLAVLNETRDTAVRAKLLRLVQTNLKRGLASAEKARDLWPDSEAIEKGVADRPEAKPAQLRKHRALLEQLDKVQQRSLALLDTSFEHIQLILDRLQPTPAPEQNGEGSGPGLATKPNGAPGAKGIVARENS
jgi:hypothetical protein